MDDPVTLLAFAGSLAGARGSRFVQGVFVVVVCACIGRIGADVLGRLW